MNVTLNHLRGLGDPLVLTQPSGLGTSTVDTGPGATITGVYTDSAGNLEVVQSYPNGPNGYFGAASWYKIDPNGSIFQFMGSSQAQPQQLVDTNAINQSQVAAYQYLMTQLLMAGTNIGNYMQMPAEIIPVQGSTTYAGPCPQGPQFCQTLVPVAPLTQTQISNSTAPAAWSGVPVSATTATGASVLGGSNLTAIPLLYGSGPMGTVVPAGFTALITPDTSGAFGVSQAPPTVSLVPTATAGGAVTQQVSQQGVPVATSTSPQVSTGSQGASPTGDLMLGSYDLSTMVQNPTFLMIAGGVALLLLLKG